MTETGWQAIGRVAKARRERLGLDQADLALYDGPKVSTVGKFERATAKLSPKTHQQIETALGWSRGVIDDFVTAFDEGDAHVQEWEHDLVFEDIPDLTRPLTTAAAETEGDAFAQAANTLERILRLIGPEHLDAALRTALIALLQFLSIESATELGRELRRDLPPEGGDGDADSAESGGSAPASDDELRRALDAVDRVPPLPGDEEGRSDEGARHDSA